jgi:quercetin dioxygenase-like cupin family protein
MTRPDPSPPMGLSRRLLLDCALPAPRTVQRVEVREITMPATTAVGAHRHPCPVFGQVSRGEILFQVDGQAPRRLQSGDVFYEPAQTPILHFDALQEQATFVAYFLLGQGEENTLEMLGA